MKDYKCIKDGWIKVKDFVELYNPKATPIQVDRMHDILRRKAARLNIEYTSLITGSRFVLEKVFCEYLEIEYKEMWKTFHEED